jgi:hypothetical protein
MLQLLDNLAFNSEYDTLKPEHKGGRVGVDDILHFRSSCNAQQFIQLPRWLFRVWMRFPKFK